MLRLLLFCCCCCCLLLSSQPGCCSNGSKVVALVAAAANDGATAVSTLIDCCCCGGCALLFVCTAHIQCVHYCCCVCSSHTYEFTFYLRTAVVYIYTSQVQQTSSVPYTGTAWYVRTLVYLLLQPKHQTDCQTTLHLLDGAHCLFCIEFCASSLFVVGDRLKTKWASIIAGG